jgi:hypothetical protein
VLFTEWDEWVWDARWFDYIYRRSYRASTSGSRFSGIAFPSRVTASWSNLLTKTKDHAWYHLGQKTLPFKLSPIFFFGRIHGKAPNRNDNFCQRGYQEADIHKHPRAGEAK